MSVYDSKARDIKLNPTPIILRPLNVSPNTRIPCSVTKMSLIRSQVKFMITIPSWFIDFKKIKGSSEYNYTSAGVHALESVLLFIIFVPDIIMTSIVAIMVPKKIGRVLNLPTFQFIELIALSIKSFIVLGRVKNHCSASRQGL